MGQEIRLTITMIGGEQTEIETPLEMVVGDFIQELCAALKLPLTDAEGHRIHWRLDNRDTGQTLDEASSLAAAGVRDGHRLSLIRSVTAGGFAATAETFSLEQDEHLVRPANLLARFLWWCSGAQTALIERLPSEYSKYQAMGIVVLADGLLAGLSGAYAFYIALGNQVIGILCGCFWGLIVFNLTRFALSSMRVSVKEEPGALPNFLKRLFPALPRLALAVAMGFVVSTPLVVRLFRNEIYDRVYSARRNNEDQLIKEIARSEASITAIQKRINEKEKEVDSLRQLLVQEMQGSGKTKMYGEGPVYRHLIDQLNQAQKELSDIRNETRDDLDKEYLSLSETKAEQKILASEVEVTPSFAAQIQALSDLSKSNPPVANIRWLMTLMFIFLYSIPLLLKLLSPPGPYDVLLAREGLGSAEKESVAIQKAFTEVLDRSSLNPRNKEATWRDVPK